MKNFKAFAVIVALLIGAFAPATTQMATVYAADDVINPDGGNDNSSATAKLPDGFKSYTKLPAKTAVEKKAKNNCKILDKVAKGASWKTRGYKRLSSSNKKVVTEVFYSGKPRSGEGNYWTLRFKVYQTSKKVWCVQNGKKVKTDGILGCIRDPQKYYSKK